MKKSLEVENSQGLDASTDKGVCGEQDWEVFSYNLWSFLNE